MSKLIEQVEPVITSERGHSWYNRGKLPPIGCECYYVTGVSRYPVKIQGVGHVDGYTVVFFVMNDSWQVATAEFFRPLLTEHEKAIGDMVKILRRFDCSPHEIAEALVDAGYHK